MPPKKPGVPYETHLCADPNFEIAVVPARRDNYAFFILNHAARTCTTIDTPCAETAINFIEERGLTLTHILNTHHHGDHVGGNLVLKSRYNAKIIGGAEDAARIPGLDVGLRENEAFSLYPGVTLETIRLDGHTIGHIGYYAPALTALFIGDCLFSLGCGRLFEGSPEQMLNSLKKITACPAETKIYCAHEYTLGNARFALHVDPENEDLQNFVRLAEEKRARDVFTVPTTVKAEKSVNPFLRAKEERLQKRLHAIGALPVPPVSEIEAFTVLRRLKDGF